MKKILVPYDFSPNAANTLRYALQFAEAADAQVTVFHALSISAKIMAAPVTKNEREQVVASEVAAKTVDLKDAANAAAATTKTAAAGGNNVDCKVTFGPIIVETIIDAAIAENADLIIMGTHGTTGLNKFLFGSVTSATISKSDIPVLAIPGGYEFSGVKAVAYASDLDNLEFELNRILPIIQPLQTQLQVLHYNYALNKQNQVNEVLQQYAANNVTLVVQKADAAIPLMKQVRKYIEEARPDILVMFTRERSMWDKLFSGSKTEDVASDLQVPLLSLKKDL